MQLANTPQLHSTTPGLHPVSIHQTSPLVRGSKHPLTAYYSVYRPRKDERLSRFAWLVTYRNKVPPPGVEPGHVTHPSTNRARRRVTSLIRPTLLRLCHAAMPKDREVYEWFTVVCSMTRSMVTVKVTSPSKLEIRLFSSAISSAIYDGSWQLILIVKLEHNM